MYGWTTAQVKERAKTAFRNFGYWNAFLVTLVISLLAGGGSGMGSGINIVLSNMSSSENSDTEFAAYAVILILVLIVSLIAIAMSVFVVPALMVGQNRFFMEHRGSESSVSSLLYAFRCGSYFNVVKVMFLMNIKLFLWYLLFIIPGIIKSFEYFAVPYILAENPGIGSRRAFEISKQMTMGEKFNIWWLGITFIGWYLLSMLACGIGGIFLAPYVQATYAEVYALLRDKAHGSGISDFSELPGFFPSRF